MTHWAADYIGKPWVNGGQGPESFDCWGLVRQVQRAHYGRDLPIVNVDALDDAAIAVALTSHEEFKRWRLVDVPQDGDCVICMKGRDNPDHIGMWIDIDGGKILQAVQQIGVVAVGPRAMRRLGWQNLEFWRFSAA